MELEQAHHGLGAGELVRLRVPHGRLIPIFAFAAATT
jgi:hypothetical protein